MSSVITKSSKIRTRDKKICNLERDCTVPHYKSRKVTVCVFCHISLTPGSLQSLDWNHWTGLVDWKSGIKFLQA